VIVQRTSVATTSSSVTTQVAVSTDLGSVMVLMIVEILPTNKTAVRDFACYLITSCYFVTHFGQRGDCRFIPLSAFLNYHKKLQWLINFRD